MKISTLVLGIGNPILCDDGIGIHVIEQLNEEIGSGEGVDIKDTCIGGLDLLDYIVGHHYEKVIIVDGIKTEEGIAGSIYRFTKEHFSSTLHYSSMHNVNLATAIETGNRCFPEEMPKEILVIGIEVEKVDEFGTKLTPKVEEAIPKAVDLLIKEIDRG